MSTLGKTSLDKLLLKEDNETGALILSEVSQKDKDHYNILTHIYGI